jgi:hypothetical protein
MAMSTAAAHKLALLIFNNTNYANMGDATGLRGSTTAGSFYVALHTADPGVGGNQSTSEATYTGYSGGARQAVARSSAGWTVGTGGAVSNAAAIVFGACTAGTNTITYQSLGSDVSGTGNLDVSGAITSPSGGLAVSAGITPQYAIGALTVTVS